MSDLSKIIANLTPEKRAQLLAKLNSDKKQMAVKREVDFSENFEFRFNSATPFDFSAVQTVVDDPAPDFVQVRAKASSLNFRDVMIASGLYPSSPRVPTNMGSDYSGVVIKTGNNVTGFKPGDEIIALHVGHTENDGNIRDNCHFIKEFNVHKECVCLKPVNLSFEAASCIPTVFLTSYIGLIDLAKLEENEKVLIHTATGGVGLSAIQIARWKNAEIFATAGTFEKRNYLLENGINHVFDSRSTDFADAIKLLDTPLDVVLNTTAAELMTESIQLLGPFGRFIHIDKKDIAANSALPMGLFINGISFQFLDISLLFRNPAMMNKALRKLVALFEEEALKPIHYTAYPAADLKQAIRTLSRSTHIGKIVVKYD
jgi:NADPH:quinone reductase-like Zn-dependent oxidoreductase